jgi:hypothetical protein
MTHYILVMFWLVLVQFIILCVELALHKFPYTPPDRSQGFYIACIFLKLPLIIWPAWLLWGT